MKTTEPVTTAESVEHETDPKQAAASPDEQPSSPEDEQELKKHKELEASPAAGVSEDTAEPATMGGLAVPDTSDAPKQEPQVPNEPQPDPTSNAPEAEQPEDVIATLHSLFPNLDKETIQDVYAGQDRDADRTAALLLQLSGQGEAAEIDEALHGDGGKQVCSIPLTF